MQSLKKKKVRSWSCFRLLIHTLFAETHTNLVVICFISFCVPYLHFTKKHYSLDETISNKSCCMSVLNLVVFFWFSICQQIIFQKSSSLARIVFIYNLCDTGKTGEKVYCMCFYCALCILQYSISFLWLMH